MKKLQKTANVVCYILSIPFRIAAVVIMIVPALSNKDWEVEKHGLEAIRDDVWDVLKYPHL